MEGKLRINTKRRKAELEEGLEPVSPITEYLLTESFTLFILAVFELEVSVDFPSAYYYLNHFFLNAHPRFSSIPVEEKKGKKMWKQVEVNVEDHVKVAEFAEDKSTEYYSNQFDNYISKLANLKMSQQKPLWELHIFNYPTKNGAKSTVIFKFHHALADGITLMGVVLSCVQRHDEPSKPLTFPTKSTTLRPKNSTPNAFMRVVKFVPQFMASAFYSFYYFGQSLRILYREDDRTPLRPRNMECAPLCASIQTLTWSLTDVKRIKTVLGVTVNDVVVGILFLGLRLYMQDINEGQLQKSRSTMLIAVNPRIMKGYATPEEMCKDKSKVPWGNRFSIIDFLIPNLEENDLKDPLKFVKKAHNIINRKRNTPFAQVLLGAFLGAVRTFGGLQAASKMFDRRITNGTFQLTNMIGPIERMSIANHPVKGFYFIPNGIKSNLLVSVMSYMEMLRIGFIIDKDSIDCSKLITCVEKAFHLILQAASTTTKNC
ncbi:unnamed protein product [Amaranthus hypochondriacus]